MDEELKKMIRLKIDLNRAVYELHLSAQNFSDILEGVVNSISVISDKEKGDIQIAESKTKLKDAHNELDKITSKVNQIKAELTKITSLKGYKKDADI